MDKNSKSFIFLSTLIITSLLVVITAFVYFYKYSSINTYNYILLTLITLTIILLLVFMLSGMVILLAYKRKCVPRALSPLVSISLKTVMPLIITASGLLKANKDAVRKFYIDVNNVRVESAREKYFPHEVLLLLPHCLQNSECTIKVTSSVDKCLRCGRCCIGEILDAASAAGVMTAIVTGGTVARKLVGEYKPKLVLSVACERDLVSGISDISGTAVIGMINERPNGPCNNTTVNAEALKRKLQSILK